MIESRIRRIAFVAGPLVGVTAIALARAGAHPDALPAPAVAMLGVTFWVALWWVTEVLPLAATSLLPVVLLPVSGILDSGQVASTYMDRFILLMMAGFMAALSLERWGLHRRLALAVLVRVGTSPRRLVLGVMIATAFLSMWIANTAATLIMLPIGLALLARVEPEIPDRAAFLRFSAALCLGIAYGASVGGMGSPIGTPPNLIYLGALHTHFGESMGFLAWMALAVPIVIVLIAFLYFYFVRFVGLPEAVAHHGHDVLRAERDALGPMSPDEKRVALIFGLMVLLWVTRQVDLDGGASWGWAPLLGLGKTVDDATVAVFGTLLLFIWPASTRPREHLLDWETARKIPWEVVLLFGGGLALAKGFEASGLSRLIAASLAGLDGLHPLLFILVIAAAVTFLSEVTSNTAITTLLMPILAPFAKASGLPPEAVLLPAALAASLGFMLPVATPPNAVAYGTGRIPIGFMARTGFWLNLIGIVTVSLILYLAHQR
jgi:sodium-dependent dicarboxylate transporter 2/3/5